MTDVLPIICGHLLDNVSYIILFLIMGNVSFLFWNLCQMNQNLCLMWLNIMPNVSKQLWEMCSWVVKWAPCACISFHFCQLFTDHWRGRTSFLSSEIIINLICYLLFIYFYFILYYFLFFILFSSRLPSK